MRRSYAGARFAVAVVLLAGVACHRSAVAPSGSPGSIATTGVCADTDRSLGDALASVCTDGVLRVAMDPARKPMSWYDAGTRRWNGFDVEVANEIAKRLGVTASLEPVAPSVIDRGSWRGRWDMSVSSMPDTARTEQRFLFSPAYYYDPAAIAVAAGNSAVNGPGDLEGATVCVAAGSTEEDYARGDLMLGPSAPPAQEALRGISVLPLPSADAALEELASGVGSRCDAVLAGWWELASFVDAGGPVRIVGAPLYYVPLSVAFDDRDARDTRRLLAAVSASVSDMHDDGTLAALSEKWFDGEDRTTASPPPSASPSPGT